MSARSWIDLITLDSPNPRRTAAFWCALVDLDVQLDEDNGRWIVLEDRTGHRVIGIQRSDERELSSRAATRVILDITMPPELFEAETERAVSLGATVLGDGYSLADPDGNRFDFMAGYGSQSAFDVAMFWVLDPAEAAAFWCAVAGLAVLDHAGARLVLGTPTGQRLLAFHECEADLIAARPRARAHIDLECDLADFDAEVDRLIDLGAVRLGAKRVEHFASGQIMVDPNGLVFCQNGYTESELASRTTPSVARGRPM
jgi:catechol 2,3-dioxygenase-like lactoylglutathione lyase family enzyme